MAAMMDEKDAKDYAPLFAVCVRALSDEVYEKRKAAALEVEKLTRECVSLQNHVQIAKLIKLMTEEFITSINPNMRKGALVGLAAIAIALGTEIGRYSERLIRPILVCMSDTDCRVRYYACESLYNVVKVSREHILPMFNDVYMAMCGAISDVDQNVRTGTELLLKLTMNIVTERKDFDLDSFIPVLKKSMYTGNQFARNFHISWLICLDHMSDCSLVIYLPQFIDPLFKILGDPAMEIRSRCEKLMSELLEELKSDIESGALMKSDVKFTDIINILVVHAQSDHITLQIMAAKWIHEFVRLAGFEMLPFIQGILTAQLPFLVFDEERRRAITDEQHRRMCELSNQVNLDLMKLVKANEKKRNEIPPSSTLDNSEKQDISDSDARSGEYELKLDSVIEVLIRQLQQGRVDTKLAVLRWFYHLFKICQPKMVNYVDNIFPVLLRTLSDKSDEVLILNIQVLAEICSTEAQQQSESAFPTRDQRAIALAPRRTGTDNPHFTLFLQTLLQHFRDDKTLLSAKGSFIIRQLCVLLRPEDIYRSFSELLMRETNLKFARLMVETLNTILLTTTELSELRNKLRDLSSTESCQLFIILYRTWCHSQIPTVALCLLSGCYRHASDLVKVISEHEVTLEMLMELDRLVQLLESPIFTALRMELLDVDTNDELVRALQSLLMIMPQTTAFRTLKDRLTCLPGLLSPNQSPAATNGPTNRGGVRIGIVARQPPSSELDFSALSSHFKEMQDKHLEELRVVSQLDQLTSGVKVLDISSDEELENGA